MTTLSDFYSIELSDGEIIRVISRAHAKTLVLAQGMIEDDFATYPNAAIRDVNGYTFALKGAPGAQAMVSNTGSVILRF